MRAPRGDRLLTEVEVSERLGISLLSARNRMRRRQLPVTKLGRLNRVRESDLDAYIARLSTNEEP
jgi:excisionase family DNA binding protein